MVEKLKQRFTSLHLMLSKQNGRRYFLIAIGLIVCSGVGLVTYMLNNPVEFNVSRSIFTPEPEPVVYYSPLTGEQVKKEEATRRQVTAIMIENSPDARPHSGLKNSGVIFEAVAEGGITRFLVLYQEDQPGLIGPVRSLRPYFASWAAAFDPSVAHVGGSARALDMIRSGKYGHDIDQFFNAGAYWRSSDRYAPHNVYTSFDRLNKLNKSKGFTSSKFDGFVRVDGEPVVKPDAKRISMDISSGPYAVSYRYETKGNRYLRYQGGEKHMDREKGQIAPKVVIAIKVDMHRAMEDGYREQIKTTGSGQAFVFQNGTVIKGRWHKSGPKQQIRFTDKNGEDIKLVRGQTWITAVPKERGVSWR